MHPHAAGRRLCLRRGAGGVTAVPEAGAGWRGRWQGARQRLGHSLRWRLVGLFVLLAVATVVVFLSGMQQSFRGGGGWRALARPLVAAAAEPWRPLDVHAGAGVETLKVRARVSAPATLGVTLTDLLPASPHRLDRSGLLTVRMEGASLASAPLAAVLAGENALAVRAPSGDWEVIAFQAAVLIASDVWRLSGLLRGQRDGVASETPIPAGAAVV